MARCFFSSAELGPPLGSGLDLGAVLASIQTSVPARPRRGRLDLVAELEGGPLDLVHAGPHAPGPGLHLGGGPRQRLEPGLQPAALGASRSSSAWPAGASRAPGQLVDLVGDLAAHPRRAVLHCVGVEPAVAGHGHGVEPPAAEQQPLDPRGDGVERVGQVEPGAVEGLHQVEGAPHVGLGGGPPDRDRREHRAHVEGPALAADQLVEVADRVLVQGEDGVDLVADGGVPVDDRVEGLAAAA